ncbi:MAG: tyrosine-type recombinase/integrase [Anaerovibrio sp.]|uniref:site-specific integrase n=1 Tax=Anaerovibrio sp. TaxID=1872532 RepID=UPI002635BBEF|nr:site-specific integrase [Anaerovibrio sp.]MDD7676934.1 tyrosine-type recombinase/integrase [Anaerovibrio sp.]MDY2603198.1 tyrosine-type recombinase/integrase [Anaerovibrio sp.]
MATVRTRKRGTTYTYIFEAGRKPDGKRRTITKGGYATKAEAYSAGIAAYSSWLAKHDISRLAEITLADFIHIWLEHISGQVTYGTITPYRAIAKIVCGFFGDELLKDITPARCEAFIKSMSESGYSQKYMRTAKCVMNQMLEYAIYPHQIITANPMEKIQIPRDAKKGIVQRTVISMDKFAELLEKYPYGSRYHMFIQLAFRTGMRISELLGLEWKNIDLQAGIIHVKQQLLYETGKGEHITSRLKTPASIRDIPLDAGLIELLARWKSDQELNRIIKAGTYTEYYTNEKGSLTRASTGLVPPGAVKVDLVCTDEDGVRVQRADINKALKEEGLNAHSFRHTHATMLIEAGASLKGVSCRLGHTNYSITNTVYIHNTEQIQSATVGIFEQLLGGF